MGARPLETGKLSRKGSLCSAQKALPCYVVVLEVSTMRGNLPQAGLCATLVEITITLLKVGGGSFLRNYTFNDEVFIDLAGSQFLE